MEDVGIFHDHLVLFLAICHISWPFGIFYGHLVYFSQFGMLFQEKSGNPPLVEGFVPTFNSKRFQLKHTKAHCFSGEKG
jgi:hypothetical protein